MNRILKQHAASASQSSIFLSGPIVYPRVKENYRARCWSSDDYFSSSWGSISVENALVWADNPEFEGRVWEISLSLGFSTGVNFTTMRMQ